MSNINTLTEIVEKQWSRNINKKINEIKNISNLYQHNIVSSVAYLLQ